MVGSRMRFEYVIGINIDNLIYLKIGKTLWNSWQELWKNNSLVYQRVNNEHNMCGI
jgi:hypothetical protein